MSTLTDLMITADIKTHSSLIIEIVLQMCESQKTHVQRCIYKSSEKLFEHVEISFIHLGHSSVIIMNPVTHYKTYFTRNTNTHNYIIIANLEGPTPGFALVLPLY